MLHTFCFNLESRNQTRTANHLIVHCFLPLILCPSVPFQTYKWFSFVYGHTRTQTVKRYLICLNPAVVSFPQYVTVSYSKISATQISENNNIVLHTASKLHASVQSTLAVGSAFVSAREYARVTNCDEPSNSHRLIMDLET